MATRSSLKNVWNNLAFLSQIEPKNFKDAENDEFWILAMQEELNQFERSDVWELVPRPSTQSVIGTKWVFRNKRDEHGETRLDEWPKVTIKKKESIMKKPLHRLQD